MKIYKTKRAAINAMWRAAPAGGNLVGDDGETIQWIEDGRTEWLTVEEISHSYYRDDWRYVVKGKEK